MAVCSFHPGLEKGHFIEVGGSSSACENVISCHEARIRRTEEQLPPIVVSEAAVSGTLTVGQCI